MADISLGQKLSPPKMAKRVFDDIDPYTVALLQRCNETGSFGIAGSGTLVSFGTYRFVLTATHVVRILHQTKQKTTAHLGDVGNRTIIGGGNWQVLQRRLLVTE